MKVYKVEAKDWFGNNLESIAVCPAGKRYYDISSFVELIAHTDEGVIRCSLQPKFRSNYRSGGRCVDPFIDQIGETLPVQASWLFHDANYTPCEACDGEHPVSRLFADELLRAMLIYAGMSKAKANLVYLSVRMFGGSAYDDDDELTKKNSKLFSFSWGA